MATLIYKNDSFAFYIVLSKLVVKEVCERIKCVESESKKMRDLIKKFIPLELSTVFFLFEINHVFKKIVLMELKKQQNDCFLLCT